MPRLVRLGMLSALSQALLKVASPGVPDYYQGTELWDFSLVDPDNRRPVDFGVRRQYLGEKEEARALLEALPDGRAKLHVIRKGLELRKELPRVFHEGSYQALHADAGMEEKVCAFALQHAGAKVIAIAPRLFAALLGEGGAAPIGEAVWKDSLLVLPEGEYEDALTGGRIGGGARRLAEILAEFPVALLVSRP
jgi:(1->4)-alpha-D-glucan 1-alpha-D-glucosylmutase